MSAKTTKAVVIGVGAERGLGAALARKFAREGKHVIIAGRTQGRLERVARTITDEGGRAEPFVTDATLEKDVLALFDRASKDDDTAPVDLVVFNAGNNQPHDFRTLTAQAFEDVWRVGCLAGFLVGREAARRLAPHGRGTIIFTGATGSLRGRPRFASFASAKAGLRSVAQAMAREFGPEGLHVAHVIIDGGINGERLNSRYPERIAQAGPDGLLDIDAIAEAYWHLHQQHRSAWTHELDLRPYKESF